MFNLRLAPALLVTLAACGGGGGGGGSAIEVPFTSFSSISGNQTVVMTGISETVSGTTDLSGTQVLTLNPSQLDSSLSTARLTYAGFGGLNGVSISTPQSSVSFAKNNSTFTCSTGVCGVENNTSAAIVMDPTTMPAPAWNYQTFGVWDQAITATEFRAGAISIGNVTPGNAVPPNGTGNFIGMANGFYIDAARNAFFTVATMSATADFTNRSIVFSTATPTLIDLNSGAQISGQLLGLEITGTLRYDLGSSQFTGAVSTTSSLSGNANGRFYGPNAEEIGGVYSLRDLGSPVRSMIGAFGGRR